MRDQRHRHVGPRDRGDGRHAVPACAVEHQYFVTEKTDRIPAGLPTLRDPDAQFLREAGARRAGRRRLGARTRGPGAPMAFRATSGPSCCSPISIASQPLAEAAAARIPMLNEVGIRQMINGPIPITADGEPIIGLSPELDNFYPVLRLHRRASPRPAAPAG